ncbi:hypothetical protein C8Q76DRAFT_860458 [Earliella scabrosa]|nr:hypothetical protein C8Q76DRAFT_860458 [Earliella scabrosa]
MTGSLRVAPSLEGLVPSVNGTIVRTEKNPISPSVSKHVRSNHIIPLHRTWVCSVGHNPHADSAPFHASTSKHVRSNHKSPLHRFEMGPIPSAPDENEGIPSTLKPRHISLRLPTAFNLTTNFPPNSHPPDLPIEPPLDPIPSELSSTSRKMSPYSPNTASGTKPRTSSNTAGSPPASAPTGTPELSVTIPQTPQTPQTPSEISVTWMDPNTYRTQPAKKQQVVETVKSSSVTAAAVNRGAVAAIIRRV